MTSETLQERLIEALRRLDQARLRRGRRCTQPLSAVECEVDGRRCLSFSSNDYLGLSQHPDVLQAFASVASTRCGSGASALVSGRTRWHEQLEWDLAEFEATPAAILFPSGFAANLGTLTSLIGEQDAVFCDRDNHASLIDGCRASGGRFFVYNRESLFRLAESLQRRRRDFQCVFIVTDAVFSMDGTLADLPQLCEIAESASAELIVDEAHATGVFGTHGLGACERSQIEDRAAVRIGTLSKALGGLGGFVAGSRELCDWLWNSARSQFFSTALPPAVCAAASAAMKVVRTQPARRATLAARARLARKLLEEAGLKVIPVADCPESPIIAILVGDDAGAMAVSERLLERGFLIPAIRPPTVPAGTARLRMSICSDHTEDQIRAAVQTLAECLP